LIAGWRAGQAAMGNLNEEESRGSVLASALSLQTESRLKTRGAQSAPIFTEKFLMNIKQVRVIMLTLSLILLGASASFADVIYDSTVTPLPGNLPSEGPEAFGLREFGDGITFAGAARNLVNVKVTLSSFACQSGRWSTGNCVSAPGSTFSVPVTFNIYNAGNPIPGSQIGTVTQTFAVPYRPSADNVNCTGTNAGKWYDTSSGQCFNGQAVNVSFDFSSQNLVLPNSVVFGVAYNSTHFGPTPIGESAACFSTAAGCPYDALNVALAPVVSVGTKPFFNTLYQNSVFATEYCDGGLAGVGIFRLDSPTSACWIGFNPAAQFNAANTPATKDACKNDGWQTHTTASGASFSNQGQCIQYFNTGK
jgi:hypothetical protein